MPPSLGHIKQKAVFPMETMKTSSVNGCYSSVVLKMTVMAVAAPFYGKKGSAPQPHLKDLFQKISPRRPNIPCTKPEETDFCMQPEIHLSYCCKAQRNGRQVSILPPVTLWSLCENSAFVCGEGSTFRFLLTCASTDCWWLWSLSHSFPYLHCLNAKTGLQKPYFVSQKTPIGTFGFVQHLMVVIESQNNSWGILKRRVISRCCWKTDFVVFWVGFLSYLLILSSRLWYKQP